MNKKINKSQSIFLTKKARLKSLMEKKDRIKGIIFNHNPNLQTLIICSVKQNIVYVNTAHPFTIFLTDLFK